MQTIYQVEIIEIGKQAKEALEENMLILFGSMAPTEIAEYCFVHNHDQLLKPLTSENRLKIGDREYPITAIGDVANKNLKELGHITLKFDGASVAEYPGCIHLKGTIPDEISIGCVFLFQ